MCSDRAQIPAHGSGRLKISSNPVIILENVLVVPSLAKTLLATKSFTEQGLTILIENHGQRRKSLDHFRRTQWTTLH